MLPRRHFHAAGLATLALWLALAGACAAPTTHPAPRNIPGIENFAQVSPTLYRGAQPTREGFAELKRVGIRTIVNLRSSGSSDRSMLKGLGLRYIHLDSDADDMKESDLIQFLKLLQDPANQPVFIHCRRGADRTGCAVATYRIVEHNWTPEQAIAEMRRFRFSESYKKIVRDLKQLDPKAMKKMIARSTPPKVHVVP